MSQTYPMMVNQPRIKLKAIRRTTGSDGIAVALRPSATFRESRRNVGSSKLQVHELLGEAYTVLSLVGIIGVLIYHVAG